MSVRLRGLRLPVVAALAVGCGSHYSATPGLPSEDALLAEVRGDVQERGLLLLEHRGEMYSLNQLADVRFRAESDMPFVREFEMNSMHAMPYIRSSTPIPYAGLQGRHDSGGP